MAHEVKKIIDFRHPSYFSDSTDWEKWRLTYQGGTKFRDRYLERFTEREDTTDFSLRRKITPIPAFAKTAVQEIRNSIFQRMRDIVRKGGSDVYQHSVNGFGGGVDRRGSTMNAFIGHDLLDELLSMGKVGVFVDSPELDGETLAEAPTTQPYLYSYCVEDILAWKYTQPQEQSEFESLLLRDTCISYDSSNWLPAVEFKRYRRMWINPQTGFVNLEFYDYEGNLIDKYGSPSAGPIELKLTKIPFVLLSIGDSLLKDVCDHQVALLNLGSSDVNYALRANFPFYIEQRDMRQVGSHLKPVANADGTATSGGQAAANHNIEVGATVGRAYDLNAQPPAFIAPPSHPLEASMKLQEKLENDIRKLVQLAVINLAPRASAESKQMDNEGLNAGLSFIGLQLESAERLITEYWAAYEHANPEQRKVATIKYPERYSLKSDGQRLDEAGKLSELSDRIPGRTFKREVSKAIVSVLLGGRVPVATIDAIEKEIEAANYTTSDPNIIIEAKNAGLVGERTASIAIGFDPDEHILAQKDHIARIKRIGEAQGVVQGAGARGVPDLDGEPGRSGSEEKERSRETDARDTTTARVRGEGR
jgi:hypothetical protein